MSGQWRAFIDAQPWNGGSRLFLTLMRRDETGRTRRYAVAPPVLVMMEEGVPYDVATLEETREEVQDRVGDVGGFLQAVVDAAWEAGIRPAGLADQSNELKAVRFHLDDMRKIAKVPGAT